RLRTPDIILAEHIDLGAGGTCFSLTNFFEQVVRFAGYDVAPVLCDRSYGADTHCALMVNANGKRFLLDPGYLLEAPIEVPISGESVQKSPSGKVRLVRLGESSQLMLITERDGKAKIRYRLRDFPASRERFRRRWIDSFDWAMMRHMCASRQTADGQLYVRDGLMRVVRGDSSSQERMKSGFADEIEKCFGIERRLVSLAHDAVKKIQLQKIQQPAVQQV
ncbi:MAG: arylamine N-acetyltransferase, partial [bacterium]